MLRYPKSGSVKEICREGGIVPQTCYTQYDQDHFHRLPPPPMETVCSYIFKTVQRDSLFLGVLKCFICNKPDTNLCAAGVMHASKTAVNKHVKETTEKTKAMAIA